MNAIFLSAAALLAAPPLAAEPAADRTPAQAPEQAAAQAPSQAAEQAEVAAAADAFLKALGSTRKTDLAGVMLPEGAIFIHNRMQPEAPRLDIVPVAQHLVRWAGTSGRFFERMRYDTVLVDGDMAQVWGPYAFLANSRVAHCGINSLSFVKRDGQWKVANTSMTMERPSECKRLGAPGMGE